MKKKCGKCGSEMDLTLRTIFFQKKLEIKNVPVYSCTSCDDHELIKQIKDKVTKLIVHERGSKQKNQVIHFEEYSEFTQLLMLILHEQEYSYSDNKMKTEIEDLIDEFIIGDYADIHYLEEEAHKKLEKLVH